MTFYIPVALANAVLMVCLKKKILLVKLPFMEHMQISFPHPVFTRDNKTRLFYYLEKRKCLYFFLVNTTEKNRVFNHDLRKML